eukprot:4737136-Pleurochrysis_carterae.AAC.1
MGGPGARAGGKGARGGQERRRGGGGETREAREEIGCMAECAKEEIGQRCKGEIEGRSMEIGRRWHRKSHGFCTSVRSMEI